MRILTNHVGYDTAGPKRAVVQHATAAAGPAAGPRFRNLRFEVRREPGGGVVASGDCEPAGTVDRWSSGSFGTLRFDEVTEAGRYRIAVYDDADPGRAVVSEPFEIAPGLLYRETFWNLLCYFKSQRCGGEEDRHDRAAAFHGAREDRVDVHGGWFDASGDTSKYLSHLSYANYLNPQQTPAVVWAMLAAREVIGGVSPLRGPALWDRRLSEEAAWGADFLVRMQDPAGYFYVTVFDRWSKDLDERTISSFRTQQGHRGADYQAGLRQGAGMAIAALARAAAAGISGEYGPDRYLETARIGFDHLTERGAAYLDDGTENIIDDYCGLLAAAELYAATGESAYAEAAAVRRASLAARFGPPAEGRDDVPNAAASWYTDHWYADRPGGRPFYHAAEAGLPAMALLRYAEVMRGTEEAETACDLAARGLRAELAVTGAVANPFGYARQWTARPGGPEGTSFFIPHENESGYWWQGENARLASLAAAALWGAAVPGGAGSTGPGAAGAVAAELRVYALDQLNWILGLNPFDVSMMDGVGRNNPEYMSEFPNAPGGICNGITAGFDDEGDIAFLPEPAASSPYHRWRWSEQWIPHAGWFLLAAAWSAVWSVGSRSAASGGGDG